MTTRYRRERSRGASKHDAITTAHKVSAQSIIVSALSFFAATFGVGMYSNIDMISSLCVLMARGANHQYDRSSIHLAIYVHGI